MADDANKAPARWQLAFPKDPSGSDQLHLVITHGDRKLGMTYSDADQQLAASLLDFAKGLLPRCHLEFEAYKGTTELDADLDKLFGDD